MVSVSSYLGHVVQWEQQFSLTRPRLDHEPWELRQLKQGQPYCTHSSSLLQSKHGAWITNWAQISASNTDFNRHDSSQHVRYSTATFVPKKKTSFAELWCKACKQTNLRTESSSNCSAIEPGGTGAKGVLTALFNPRHQSRSVQPNLFHCRLQSYEFTQTSQSWSFKLQLLLTV